MDMEGKENMEKVEVLLKKNSDGLQCTEKLSSCKNATCAIWVDENENIRHGSGFFTKVVIKGVEVKCIATNNHVLPSAELARDGKAIFYYEGSQPGIEAKLEPDKLFYTNEVLDYTLIGCDANEIENTYCITPLEMTDTKPNVGDDVFIFQHPKGKSKKVSYQKISNIQPPYVFYQADTDIGSSGSPVLGKFQLIAIHSKGSEDLRYNKGTLCSEIIQHLNYGLYTNPQPVRWDQTYGRKRESSNTSNEHVSAKKSKNDMNIYKDPNKQPSEKDLQTLACDLANDWKRLGRELELTNSDISRIQKDNINFDDVVEKAFAMLLKWQELRADQASFGALRDALTNIGLVATAKKHC